MQTAPATPSVFYKEAVEAELGQTITHEEFAAAESYARRKLRMAQERNPEITYYNDEYLVLLTADTVREQAFSNYTISLSMARTLAAYTCENEKN